MARITSLADRVPIVQSDGTATQYFTRQWAALRNLPEDLASGRLTISAASDTQLVFSYRGSDGIVRSAALTLS